ncbi:aminotransferase class V-fold PLP-dependent enzyme [Limoniibacter endophyticus]|uniref:Class V aminotransferase n=1 Tax=Limoniibacter endophyticus TaxID=1565040 RepID=A0A8J3DPW5_9HYPH|nr:aminotransferase class V-fold PLP-dependent enzyme [Limoniibacter endophyticus]GHC72225.1 class V aminotransferase [Limoniibacter endophyticus]
MSGYFLYHSIGTFSGKDAAMAEALRDFSSAWSAEDDNQWPTALAARQSFINAWERLIGAPSGSLTVTENVTLALYTLIGSLPSGRLRGKRVLVAQDCFPSLHFLLNGLSGRFGFTLETVPFRQGEFFVHDEDFLARWNEDVGLALVTFVSSTTSKKVDIDALRNQSKRMGSIMVVDVTQGVGIAPFAVSEGIDVVIGSSLKWLCGASGAGVLQIEPSLLAQCEPELRGWFSQPNPFSWGLDDFSYAPDVRRFDHGTPAVLASVASQPGIEFVLETGVETLATRNRQLVSSIVEMAQALEMPIVSPLDAAQRGGSIMIQASSPEVATQIQKKLKAEGLFCDNRGAIIRFSPGIVTGEDAVAHLGAVMQEFR